MYSNSFNELMECLPEYLAGQGIDASGMFRCPYPEHEDTTPSAHIFQGKFVKCFGCGRVMTIFDIAHYLEGLPIKGDPDFFKENVTSLARKYGITLPKWSESVTLDIHSAVLEFTMSVYIPEKVEKLNCTIPEYLNSIPNLKLNYLQNSIPVVIKLPPISRIVSYLLEKGFTNLQIKLAGYVERIETEKKQFGVFTDVESIGYPLWLSHSVCTGFSVKNPSGTPKYINTANNDCFTKGKYLYGLFFGVDISKPLYIVEGQKDTLALWERGYQAAAPLGSHLTKEQIDLVLNRGFRQVILCPDADDGGKLGTISSVEKLLAKGLVPKLIKLPEGLDPYDYLIENQNEKLPEPVNGLEIYVDHLKKLGDLYTCTGKLVDLLSEVPNRIQREFISKELAPLLEITSDALQEDIENLVQKKINNKNSSVISVMERGLERARNNPEEAVKLMREAQEYIEGISNTNNNFDNNFTIDLVRNIKTGKSNNQKLDIHFRKDGLGVLSDMLHEFGSGWTRGKLFAVGGDPHCNKTGTLLQVLAESLIYAPDVMCIHFSTDDASEVLLPRIISSLIFSPDFYISHSLKNDLTGSYKLARDRALKKIEEWASSERLIMKDQNFSTKFARIADLTKYYRDKYPERRILLFNDNFHRNADYSDRDKLTKQELLSTDAKTLAVREKLSLWCTVEYRKNKELAMGRRSRGPVNADIKGDGSLSYHADLIINLYNDYIEQNADIENTAAVHVYNGETFPRVVLNISKNKISGNNGPVTMNLFPKSSFSMPVSREIADKEEAERLKKLGD